MASPNHPHPPSLVSLHIMEAEQPQGLFPTLPWNWEWLFDPFLVKEALSRFAEGLLGKIFCFLVKKTESFPWPPIPVWDAELRTKSYNHETRRTKTATLKLAEQKDMWRGSVIGIEPPNELSRCLLQTSCKQYSWKHGFFHICHYKYS